MVEFVSLPSDLSLSDFLRPHAWSWNLTFDFVAINTPTVPQLFDTRRGYFKATGVAVGDHLPVFNDEGVVTGGHEIISMTTQTNGITRISTSMRLDTIHPQIYAFLGIAPLIAYDFEDGLFCATYRDFKKIMALSVGGTARHEGVLIQAASFPALPTDASFPPDYSLRFLREMQSQTEQSFGVVLGGIFTINWRGNLRYTFSGHILNEYGDGMRVSMDADFRVVDGALECVQVLYAPEVGAEDLALTVIECDWLDALQAAGVECVNTRLTLKEGTEWTS